MGYYNKTVFEKEKLDFKRVEIFSIIKFFNSREHLIDSRADQSPL